MDVYVSGFQSSDTKIKITTAEKFLLKLNRRTWLSDAPNDERKKVISGCLGLIRDANPKVVLLGFDCMEAMITTNGETFQPYINLSFDTLLNKFSDNKAQLRTRASELTITLFTLMDLSVATDRLVSQLTHKNFRIREQVLVTIGMLQDRHGQALRSSPGMIAKIAALFTDQQGSIRQLAIETIVKLHQVFGNLIASYLEDCGVKPSQIKAIMDASNPHQVVKQQSQEETGKPPAAAPPTRRVIPVSGVENSSKNVLPAPGAGEKALQIAVTHDDSLTGLATPSRLSVTSSAASSKRHVSAGRQRPSLGATTSSGTAVVCSSPQESPLHLGGGVASSGLSPGGGGGGESSPAGLSAVTWEGASPFDPAYFMGLVRDGAACPPVRLQSAKDMDREFLKVKQGLGNALNWNLRIAAMQQLHRLAVGNLADFECGPALRQFTDALVAQISDLRSAVCKEGCRTLAALAHSLGSHFRPLSEQWIPCLRQVVSVKIAVMSSAADRCVRVLVAMCPENRLLGQLLEGCTAKNAQVRTLFLEYVSLAAALWKADLIEKNLSGIKTIIAAGVGDADAGARRASRLLFLTLQSRPQLQAAMDLFLRSDLDGVAQKHIQTEYQTPSSELNDLLQLSRNPAYVSEYSSVSDKTERSLPIAESLSAKSAASTKSAAPPAPQAKEASVPIEDRDVFAIPDASAARANRRSSLSSGAVRLTTGSKLASTAPSTGIEGILLGPETEEPKDSSITKKMAATGSRRMSLAAFDGLPSRATPGSLADSSHLPVPPAVPEPAAAETPASGGSRLADSLVGFESTNRRASMGGRLADGPKRVIRASVEPAGVAPERKSATVMASHTAVEVKLVDSRPATSEVRAAAVPTPSSPAVPPAPPSTASIGSPPPSTGAVATASPSVFVFSADTLRTMTEDGEWGVRLRAFESIAQRLQRAASSGEPLTAGLVEPFLDLCVAHMGDPHHRVAAEALGVVQQCLAHFTEQSKGRVGPLVAALFHRLADRRPAVKDHANAILNQIRVVFDPLVIIAALSPKISEISDRMKTALMQFLAAIAPFCTDYFAAPQNTWAFLGRMANILGAGGSKPSTGLSVAGRRLLELVYKTCPGVVCSQLATLTVQQQTVVKQMLQASVPDIDSLVLAARQEPRESKKSSSSNDLVAVDSRWNGDAVERRARPQAEAEEEEEEDVRVVEEVEEVLDEVVSEEEWEASPVVVERVAPAAPAPPSALVTDDSATHFLDYEARKLALLSPPKGATASSLMVRNSPAVGFRKESGVSFAASVREPAAALLTPTKQSFQQFSLAAPESPPQQTAAAAAARSTVGQLSPSRFKDTMWLLLCMQPEASLADKTDAARELKTLAKSGEDAYWQKNFAQIVSVLLESFNPAHLTRLTPGERQSRGGGDPSDFQPASSEEESLHIVTKMLLLLVKYRGALMKNFIDLLVSKLCLAAERAPAALNALFERILVEIGHYEPARLLDILIPFAGGAEEAVPAVRLLALHVMCDVTHFLTSAELLAALPELVPAVLPSLGSEVVDLRKAVIFVLVEVYLTVNDALFPFLTSLQSSQRKLLTIYIEKKMAARKQP